MTEDEADEPPTDPQRVFDQIWWQNPEKQNRTSSSWWFFILFPDGEDGYGPRQLMFSIAARVGDRIRVNDVWLPGMDLNRTTDGGVDRFDAISVGWDGDDERVDDRIVNQPAKATLSRDGSLVAWDDDDGERRGSEIRASTDRPLGLEAEFVGEKGSARFEAWGDLDSEITSPIESMDMDTVAGGVNVVAWRRMQFEGEFDLPSGQESLEGLCYFQRVCFNVPLFPWKWIWAFFPDGTAFSAMIPYMGPQLFRKGYDFFASNALERASLPIQQSALWNAGTSEKLVEFDSVTVTPILNDDSHPDFSVQARNEAGDYVEFVASSYGHARNHIDRPILGDTVESHWSYNEYLFRMTELEGHIEGDAVNEGTAGQGYGTLEYTWGLGL